MPLERPSDPHHGDYATNVALRLAGEARSRRARSRASSRSRLGGDRGVAAVEVAGPGFVNLDARRRLVLATSSRAILAAGSDFGGGSAETPERIQVEMVSANPTGPITVAAARNGAYGDCVARLLAFAGHTGRARVLLQRRRRADGPLPRVRRRGRGGARSHPRTATTATTSPSSPRAGRPRAGHARADRGARSSGSASTSTPSSARASSRRRSPRRSARSRRTRRTARLWVAHRPRTATTKDRVAACAPTGRRRTSPPTLPTSAASTERGFDRLIYVLGADHHGYVSALQALAEMLGHPRDRSRCWSTSSSI